MVPTCPCSPQTPHPPRGTSSAAPWGHAVRQVLRERGDGAGLPRHQGLAAQQARGECCVPCAPLALGRPLPLGRPACSSHCCTPASYPMQCALCSCCHSSPSAAACPWLIILFAKPLLMAMPRPLARYPQGAAGLLSSATACKGRPFLFNCHQPCIVPTTRLNA
jgi:hypothetical protein